MVEGSTIRFCVVEGSEVTGSEVKSVTKFVALGRREWSPSVHALDIASREWGRISC
jgi:hypothetical protein